MNAIDLFTPNDIKLAEHAEVIRALGKRAVQDIIEIGRRLIEAKELAGHGGWLPWLEREFGWEERTARNFISVAEAAGKTAKFADLNVPVSGLYLLAAPSTPDEVIEAIAERSEQGERVLLDDVKKMIAEADGAARERIAKLQAEHDAEVAALREEAAKIEPALPLAEIEARIKKAVEPLKERIKKLNERLAKKKKAAPSIPNPHGAAASRVEMALQALVDVIVTITPAEKIAAERVVEKTTGQPVGVGLAGEIRNAKAIQKWVADFLKRTGELKQ